jgi:steroid delta-isomerase-like uncharacterized protein
VQTRRWFDEVWNERRSDIIQEFLRPDSICYSEGSVLRGVDDFRDKVHTVFLSAFPDFRVTVEGTVTEGDVVVVRWSFTGTHTGDGFGIPPTGKQVTARGMTWIRFENGKMVEGYDCWNLGGLMQSLREGGHPDSSDQP